MIIKQIVAIFFVVVISYVLITKVRNAKNAKELASIFVVGMFLVIAALALNRVASATLTELLLLEKYSGIGLPLIVSGYSFIIFSIMSFFRYLTSNKKSGKSI